MREGFMSNQTDSLGTVDNMNEKKVLLLVEDNKDLRDLIVRRAEKMYNWVCLCDESGDKCISMSRQYSPDAILLDMGLPKISGLGLLRMLKNDASLKNIPVVVFSAYGFPELVLESVELGADAYFTKSEHLASIFSKLESCINSSSIPS